MAANFGAGEACLLYDAKGRTYLIKLSIDGEFQYHRGVVPHSLIIDEPEGCFVESSMGSKLVAVRPRLADYTLKMPRGAAVVYPKDTGAIVMWADIHPGATVLEAGTGSGALTLALLRAVGDSGRVVSVEQRSDHAQIARDRIEGFIGNIPKNLELRIGDVEDNFGDVAPDRVVLDLPEPWHSVAPAVEHMRPGGVFCCYVPTIPQVQEVRKTLARTGSFIEATTFEVLHREWAIEGRSVRPNHRMQGHTGFITVARRFTRPDPESSQKTS
ncbi:MAG: tRNA (adenine-N1)-methyltransferase [Acidimicrobiia bacterium]|nr:tRNA (adenine-N1)-methyltransferase [Acidimicrobiia bacterium]